MDLDRLLKESLREVGGEFHPSDPAAARHRFLAARRRRKWFVIGEAAGAVALASLLIIFVTTVDLGGERGIRLATSVPEVVATIPAGGEPVAVAVGEGAVWMTDSTGVMKIDPRTDEVLDTVPMGGGQPDEIVAGNGYVWASDTTGSIYKIDPATGDAEITRLTGGDDVHLDIALSSDDLWAVDPATGGAFTVSGGEVTELFRPLGAGEAFDFSPTDVAADGDQVWAYDPSSGGLMRLSGFTEPASTENTERYSVPEGDRNSDLALGFGSAWVATGAVGQIHRVSLVTGEVLTTIDVGGGYTDLTVDVAEGVVWALAIDQDAGTSELFQIRGGNGELVGEPLSLDAVAADVSAGEGSIWVPGRDGDVLRIAPREQEPETEVTLPVETSADDIVFVYSDDGDIWAQYADRSERLTDGPEIESAPAITPDGSHVLFTRGDPDDGADSEVVTLDLATGEECCRVAGTQPAVGPMEQVAYVVEPGMPLPSTGEEALAPAIAITRIGSTIAESYPALPVEAYIPGMSITELLWDQSGQVLYLEVEYEGRHIRTADVILDENQLVEDIVASDAVPTRLAGARFSAPSVGTSLNVVQSCCGFTEGEIAERHVFGHIDPFPEQDFAFDRIVDLERLEGFDPPSIKDPTGGPIETAFIGQYTFDGENFRADDASPGWLIGDGTAWWWVTMDGDVMPTQLTADDISAPYPHFDGSA